MNADRIGAIAVVLGPLLLLGGILWHPYIPDLTDSANVVHHLQQDTAKWFGAHFLVAVGSAVLLLGFLSVRAHVRTTTGREPWTGRAIVPLVVGTVLFAMLPAMEIAMLAVERAGGDLLATQKALDTWFKPIFLAGALLMGVGSVLFALGVHRATILPPTASRTVLVAFVISALSRVPFTLALIVGIVALNVAMLPLAVTMWNAGRADRPMGDLRATSRDRQNDTR